MLTISLPSHDTIDSEHEMQALIIKSMNAPSTEGQTRLRDDLLNLLRHVFSMPDLASSDLYLYSEFDFIDLVFEAPRLGRVVGVELKWGSAESKGQTLHQFAQLGCYFPDHMREHVFLTRDGGIPQLDRSFAVRAVRSEEHGAEPGLEKPQIKYWKESAKSSNRPEARIASSLPANFGPDFAEELCGKVEDRSGHRFVTAQAYRGEPPVSTTNGLGWGEGRYLRLCHEAFANDARFMSPMNSDGLQGLPFLVFQLYPFGVGMDCMFSSLAKGEFQNHKAAIHDYLKAEAPDMLLPAPKTGLVNYHYHHRRVLSVVEHGSDPSVLRTIAMDRSVDFICHHAPLYETALRMIVSPPSRQCA